MNTKAYDEPVNGAGEALLEQLTATHFEPVHILAENNVLHGMLEDVLATLTERESKGLKLRCDLLGGRPHIFKGGICFGRKRLKRKSARLPFQ
ncbi:MAG: hypothetical protein IJO76_04055 [Clostridia bacterium]|nr:hypothetical protein [Clostridia bacterium]